LATNRQFGVSTHLFHAQRLAREHLAAIAAHGFTTVDVFATRSHFDYHSPSAAADLQEWLAAAGLELNAVHAPVGERYENGRWSGLLSIASADADARAYAVSEAERALHVARRISIRTLIVHLGPPRGAVTAGPQSRASARRSLEELAKAAEPLGVRMAIEVLPNELSRAGSLVHLIETDLAGSNVGICFDFGHAHLDGRLVDAVETTAEHMIAAELHDNRGRHDDHLVPLDGVIDWPSALTFVQKVGYDGALVFELAAAGPPKATLARAAAARERIKGMLTE
jgi:sugar phosphate isomerase/epimerase